MHLSGRRRPRRTSSSTKHAKAQQAGSDCVANGHNLSTDRRIHGVQQVKLAVLHNEMLRRNLKNLTPGVGNPRYTIFNHFKTHVRGQLKSLPIPYNLGLPKSLPCHE